MKIVHVLNSKAIEKGVAGEGELSFMLSNSTGGFVHFSTSNSSKYQGFFARIGNSLFKILESVNVASEEEVAAVENTGYSAILHRGSFYELFFLPQKKNCLVYQSSIELPVELSFDIMPANDFRQWGRHYKAAEAADNSVIVHFIKKTDSREDKSNGGIEYEVFAAIRHDGFVSSLNGEWVRRSYSLDAKRNSASERYVYRSATITAKTLVISAAESAGAALKEANSIFKSVDRLKKESKVHYDGLCKSSPKQSSGKEDAAMAANAAAIALDKLKTSSGMYAGLPWFFQEWSRDELVSCVAFPATERKKVVLKHLDRILDDGRLPNIEIGKYSGSPAGCSDSVGWLFKRASDLHYEKKFTAMEVKKLKSALKKSIDGLLRHHSKNGFITNEKNETWMDTSFNDDGRKGACIEIQAMQLNMYSLMHRLSREKTYLLLEKSLRQNVRKFFWNGSILADRLNDYTVRPNIFIAAYFYPQLLSRKEWESCMQGAISKLWLGWGGLATIDKGHANFRSSYTGENNASYHRGDSWFWLNNLAAAVMTKINKRKFKHYIEKIAAASTNDILWKGAVGCGSELSSASTQKAEGCLCQAWSNATFVELAGTAKIPATPAAYPRSFGTATKSRE